MARDGALVKAVVVGGGVAGLAAAHRLAQQGWDVTVYERDPVLGGLASSFEYDGATLERYYHFICRPDAPYLELIDELGLTPRLNWQPTRMGYVYEGRYHPFGTPWSLMRFSPLSLASRVRFGIHALRSKRMTDWADLDGITAREWLTDNEGEQAYDVVWRPLLELKFGAEADKVSAAWMWARINRVANSRTGVLMREWLGALEGGTQVLINALADRIDSAGGAIRTHTPVRRITIEEGRARGVVLDIGAEEEADVVVSAVAPPLLLEIAPDLPQPYAGALRAIDYYAVACWLLVASEPMSRDFWLNVHDANVTFPGVIQYTNLNPIPGLSGRHVLYIPYYMSVEDERYSLSLEEWLPRLKAELDVVRPGFAEKVESFLLLRDPYAQPLFPAGFGERFASLADPVTPVGGLYRTDMSQVYPADRSLVNAIDKANAVAAAIGRPG